MKKPYLIGTLAVLVAITVSAQTPSIASISPTSTTRSSDGVALVITGSNLTGAPNGSVTFSLPGASSIVATSVQVSQDGTRLVGALKACGATPGSYSVSVTTPNGTSNSLPFPIDASVPVIGDTAPRTFAPGTFPLTILGCGVDNVSSIVLEAPLGVTFTNISSTSTQVTATASVSASMPNGDYAIQVGGANGWSNLIFILVAGGVPSLSALSPSAASPGSAFTFTLTGQNLGTVSGLIFTPSNGITVSGINASASQVTATIAVDAAAAPGSYSVQAVSPMGTSGGLTFSVAPPNYVGYVDHQGCDSIYGWAADRNRLNNSINVEIYDGNLLLMTTKAKLSRPDVGSFLGDNGMHGFNIPTPPALQDGGPHQVHLRFEQSGVELTNSPHSLTCAPLANYVGYVDHLGCDSINGWAADRNRLNTSINVRVYDSGTLIAIVPANLTRPDVGQFLGDNGIHGFSISTPASLQDGQTHEVHIDFETSAVDLTNSPAGLTCTGG
ncbi:MAG TPA: IPT/TIG domain-containing protein [Candidatus Angelobacter sp.]